MAAAGRREATVPAFAFLLFEREEEVDEVEAESSRRFPEEDFFLSKSWLSFRRITSSLRLFLVLNSVLFPGGLVSALVEVIELGCCDGRGRGNPDDNIFSY